MCNAMTCWAQRYNVLNGGLSFAARKWVEMVNLDDISTIYRQTKIARLTSEVIPRFSLSDNASVSCTGKDHSVNFVALVGLGAVQFEESDTTELNPAIRKADTGARPASFMPQIRPRVGAPFS
jgi:hypothetical protein